MPNDIRKLISIWFTHFRDVMSTSEGVNQIFFDPNFMMNNFAWRRMSTGDRRFLTDDFWSGFPNL